jgi:outer membrane protein assembly factor BamA
MTVEGVQRLEPDTVLSYVQLRPASPIAGRRGPGAEGSERHRAVCRPAVRNDNGHVTITVQENPVINRIVLEGNKHLKEDKINPEIKLAPRQIFTRSKVRADVPASSSFTSARAVLPPASSPRWSSWTRTASISSLRSTKAPSPRSARST